MSTIRRTDSIVLGWREWIALPDWGVPHLKAKIDTGARTSSLHAFGLEWFDRGGNPWVRFEIHPLQRSIADVIVAEAAVVATRDVKSSSGATEHRPVVHTTLVVAGHPVVAEITLTRRDEMGFRMLIGREALRRRFVVDPAVSYRGGRPDKSIRRRNRAGVPTSDSPTDDGASGTASDHDAAADDAAPSNNIAAQRISARTTSARKSP